MGADRAASAGRGGGRVRTGWDNRLFAEAVRAGRARGETDHRSSAAAGRRIRASADGSLRGIWQRRPRLCGSTRTSSTSLWPARSARPIPTPPRRRGSAAAGIGRSRAELTSEVHSALDALGLPLPLAVTPGQRGDCPLGDGPDRRSFGGWRVSSPTPPTTRRLRAGPSLSCLPRRRSRPTRRAQQGCRSIQASRPLGPAQPSRALLPAFQALPPHRPAMPEDPRRLSRAPRHHMRQEWPR